MRRRVPDLRGLPALVLVPLLMATACGGGADDDQPARASRAGEADDACGQLSADEATALVGVPMTATSRSLPGVASCTFTADDPTVTLSILRGPARDLDDAAADLAEGSDSSSTEPVEVSGAEAALLLDTTMSSITTTALLATAAQSSYTVFAPGLSRGDEARVAVGALTALLGGDLPAESLAPTGDVPHPCRVLDAATVTQALGVAVRSARADLPDVGYLRCRFEPRDADPELAVTLTQFEDPPALDAYRSLSESTGAEVTELEVDGLQQAFVSTTPLVDAQADLYGRTALATYELEVRAASTDDAVAVATQLAPALAGG